jgi:hypothetical protein
MSLTRLFILSLIVFTSYTCVAQADTALQQIQELPKKYITAIDTKIDKYQHRITNKTEKTLSKLAKWENKIKNLLEKASPETAQRLFGEGRPTFNSLLQQLKNGEQIVNTQRVKYDEYRDKLTTSLKYLEDQKQSLDTKLIQPIQKANKKLTELETEVKQQEAIEAFIKERKRELINEAVKHIGNSKYLTKINKESYYYIETIKNYKEIFSDKKKTEETALTILNKIPAFKRFVEDNSMLAQLFGSPNATPNLQNLQGLQTRASVNTLIQNQLAAGGPNAQAQMQQNLQQAQAELSKLKDKVLKGGGSSSTDEIADFKINPERSKTFKQRLEYNTNIQFGRNNNLLPATTDLGVSIGYKFSDSKILGIGISYKMGLGSIQKIQLSHQGISIRSFADFKLKKQFFLTSGYEMNHNAAFNNIQELKQFNAWQSSGLVGISKKITFSSPTGGVRGGLTKYTKGTKLQLLYDLLARQHTPVSQQWIFRVGYQF